MLLLCSVDELGYEFPYETNSEVLQLLISHLCGAPALLTRARNARLYALALHHVSIHLFGWAHVSGASVVEAGERVARVRSLLPITTSPEVIKDLMNYRFHATEAQTQKAHENKEEEKAS